MFRKKAGLTANVEQRHKKEREQLTHHFHRSLKCLQQKEHVDGATIVSNEASNNLCNVLEAVFLHGVKDNVVTKLVSYAQGSSSEIKTNFWDVVKKFTHKDVITQLKQLTQINTDIGLCRAWIRLAINDGLMASYLASMTADLKALMVFYHPWAYLLDYEQPEILRNHLTGLMGLNFNLSSNSSILNKWSSTTVAFAGLVVETPVPSPVIRPGSPSPPSARRVSESSITSMDSLLGLTSHSATTTTTATTTTASTLTTLTHTTHMYTTTTTVTPPNTPADPPLLNMTQDMEAVRKLATRCRSSSVSSCSSSQVSCPDPSEPPNMDGLLSGRSSRSNSPYDRPQSWSAPYVNMTREDRKLDEQMKLKAILDHMDRKERERVEKEDRERLLENERKKKELYATVERERREKKERERRQLEEEQIRLRKEAEEQYRLWQREKEERLAQTEREDRSAQKEREGRSAQKEREGRSAQKEREGGSAQKEREDGSVQKEKAGGSTLKEREDRSVQKEREDRLVQRDKEENWVQREAEGHMEHHPSHCTSVKTSKQKSEDFAVEPESQNSGALYSSTDHLINTIEDAMTTFESSQEKEEVPSVQGGGGGDGGVDGEADIWSERESSYGNSLNAMDGWSTASPCHARSTLEVSYESVLKGYQAHRGSRMATVQDVLDGIPDAHSAKAEAPKEQRSEPFTAVDMSDDDIDFADYEIIHSSSEESDAVKIEQMKSLCSYQGKNAQSNVCASPGCNVGVGFFHGPGLICELDGRTYCEQCHLSQFAYIPAEIIFNWNFKKRKVCAENYKFLQRVQDQPLLDMDEISMQIYSTVPAMNTVMRLRERLTSLRSYMFTCSESTARQLKDRVWPREHLYNKVHLYSVNDLLEVKSGRLELFLKEVVDLCAKHVYSCSLCLAKGFYCELCQDPTPIFPFEVDTTVKCKTCRNVYHSHCKTDVIQCPKCLRYSQRGIRRWKDDDDDYACSPE